MLRPYNGLTRAKPRSVPQPSGCGELLRAEMDSPKSRGLQNRFNARMSEIVKRNPSLKDDAAARSPHRRLTPAAPSGDSRVRGAHHVAVGRGRKSR